MEMICDKVLFDEKCTVKHLRHLLFFIYFISIFKISCIGLGYFVIAFIRVRLFNENNYMKLTNLP